jgi:DHA1 family bicyclomycin/chloramphenicol resistance-like MFS transporter
VLLAAMTAIGMSSLHIVVPVLPILAAAFGDASVRVQLVVSLYLAGIAVGQLVYGPLSDRFGRRPVLLCGLSLFLSGTLLCAGAWSLSALIVGRILQGAGACAGIVLARAIIRDVYEREEAARGIALMMMAMTLAPAVSPAIGAYLAEWIDWRAIFAFLGLLGAVVLALTAMQLGETNTRPARFDLVGMTVCHLGLLSSRQFIGFAFCGACASAGWFAFCASTPQILVEAMGRPPATYGIMILLPMTTYMLGNAVAAQLTIRLGTARMIVLGRALAFAAAVAMVLWYGADGLGIWMLFVPVAFSSIGDGMSQPSALAGGLSIRPDLAGTASGLMGFAQMATAAIGTLVVALLPWSLALSMIVVVAGFIALSLAFGILALRRPGRGSALQAATARP